MAVWGNCAGPRGVRGWSSLRLEILVNVLCIAGISVHLASLSAQAPVIQLKPADASLFHEFTAVGSIRELADGRILVNDPLDHIVLVCDFKSGKVARVGRVGPGPGEYPQAWPLSPMAHDSSVMLDALARRWTFFRGASVVGQLAPDNAMARGADFFYGSDTLGHMLGRKAAQTRRSSADSGYLELFTPATSRVDTVARLFPSGPFRDGDADPPFVGADKAAISSDGWIAVLRANEYRVDWRAPDGRWYVGPTIPHEQLAFDGRERAAWLERHPGRGYSAYAQRRLKLAPAQVPPFDWGQLLPSPDGRLLIQRTVTADHPSTRYDVVTRAGRLQGQIEMPSRATIQAFGPHSVYVVIRNFNDDTEHIERHPWP